MLNTLITSKTRLKLLLKFFLNTNNRAYLRNLESEFQESSNAIRLELNRFESAGMLVSEKEGNRKYFRANNKHPLFGDIQSIIKKVIGVDQVIENIVKRLGTVERVYIEGRLARGLDSNVIDLVLIGKEMDRVYLTKLIEKVEPILNKDIRYVIKDPSEELEYLKQNKESFLIWNEQ